MTDKTNNITDQLLKLVGELESIKEAHDNKTLLDTELVHKLSLAIDHIDLSINMIKQYHKLKI